jgi:hypothetical protein
VNAMVVLEGSPLDRFHRPAVTSPLQTVVGVTGNILL